MLVALVLYACDNYNASSVLQLRVIIKVDVDSAQSSTIIAVLDTVVARVKME